MVEVPVPFTLSMFPMKAMPEVSRTPSLLVAFPTPRPPDTYRSLVTPFLPMTTSPGFKSCALGLEEPNETTPF